MTVEVSFRHCAEDIKLVKEGLLLYKMIGENKRKCSGTKGGYSKGVNIHTSLKKGEWEEKRTLNKDEG